MGKLKLSRRNWIRLAVAGSAAAVLVDTFWIEPHWLEIVQRELKVRGLPASWRGKTLMQISDIHVGPQVSDDYLIKSFAFASEFEPDIVAYTGDFVSVPESGPISWDQIDRVYQYAPRGKHATLAVLGNHDYHKDYPDLSYRLLEVLNQHGMAFVQNSIADLNGLYIGGVDDLWHGNCDIASITEVSEDRLPQVVLCHNPDAADLPEWGEFKGWILSGHTHGGQCKPPFLPPPLLPVKNRRYTAGYFDLFDGRQLYINRALGHLTAVRFNCRPEITLFELA